ncbi:cold-shock protein [Streptomyces sp. NBC_01233]|uniref:cold-shock protein n=1 Tax=Streptomyces sp. NBC_01233 TaxID=2903787 RepID=UPI003FA38F30|nr:cold shock domain-containing protein [Streptomyces sp. NBC_01233]
MWCLPRCIRWQLLCGSPCRFRAVRFRNLEENQRVEFEIQQGQRGLQATDVRAL